MAADSVVGLQESCYPQGAGGLFRNGNRTLINSVAIRASTHMPSVFSPVYSFWDMSGLQEISQKKNVSSSELLSINITKSYNRYKNLQQTLESPQNLAYST
ncbi:hypothetical protein OUZ56_021268 [Daphnia magna]|uniref:Uncharacterized protein n=1 Tax=Daphnia magna TaxID=35525 RepID=A0ABQ9ZGY8_9CRUS|nr:hypothetical protein OUZ56_021268 [Daphnia magna]